MTYKTVTRVLTAVALTMTFSVVGCGDDEEVLSCGEGAAKLANMCDYSEGITRTACDIASSDGQDRWGACVAAAEDCAAADKCKFSAN
jgi:hypothetical protein